jgi:NAD(P)-dependent dehydrogenase (short-subunit alcohol dehydrogenase family)/acyl carrier protein
VTYAAAPSAPGPAWLGAWQEAQRQTAEAHAAWQNAMTAGHDRFLRTVETGFLGLTSALTGQPLSAAPAAAWTPAPPRQLAAPAPVYAAPAPVYAAPAPVYAAPAPVYAAPAPVYAAPAPVAPAPVAPAPVAAAPAVKPAPAPAVKPAPVAAAPVAAKAPVADLGATLLAVVADKTGYPADLLHLEMELEGDLGVDSIKRVEILGAMQEKVPGLPEVDPAAVASMKTLGQILSFLREKSGGAAPAPAAPAKPAPVPTAPAAANGVHAAAPAQAAPAGKGGNIDLPALLLAIVADKTGYPADLLHLDMELEGDLGIDSIKRVEILSAVQERAPGLPEVEAAEMASLRTLGQIQEHLMSKLGGAAASPSTAGSLVNPSERTGRAIGRFTLELVKIPAAGLVLAGLGAGTVRVIPDDLGVADGLLRERGYDAAVGEPTAETRSLLVLTGLSALPDRAAATALDRRAFEAARAFARLPGGGVFLTVQDTGGSFGAEPVLAPEGAVSRAWLSGLSALARTGAQEWPDRAVKALDVEVGGRPAPVVARVILDELLAGGPEREVALRADGLRRVPRSVSTPAAPRAGRPLPERAVVVVTGGARGVTAACCLSLAEAQPCRFALLGRTPLLPEPAEARGAADEGALKKALVAAAISRGERPAPAQISKQVSQILASREVEATLLGLQARGSEARYLAADAADAASLGEALAAVRAAWGPIQALVHGAGVIADKAIAEKSDEAFARVYDTKVAGLQALLDRTAGDPLAAILLFSSVAARAGNAGQCDYAMANEVLNKVAWAEAARRPGCVVRALGWGPWEGGMVTPALKALFAARGVPMIPILDGAHAFVDELLDPSREGEVVLGGEPKAEALAGQRAPAEARYEIVVDGRFTVLDDHSIQGVPVVPVVFALEWFTRAVQAFRPGLFLQELRDVKVLRGIPLPSYAERPGRLLLTVKALAEDELLVELRDATGGLRYTARARTGPAAPRPGPRAAEPRLEGWADRPVYDGHALFHGPRFQVITAMEGVSAEGLAARLTDMSALGWPSLAWTTDPAVNDGALQLAVLWSKHMLGGAALPTAIGSVRSYRPEPLAGPLRAVLVGRSSRGERTVSDLWMLDEQGVVVLAFEGVETHRRPGEPAQA